ncbi:unnamed protein product [Amoebophrya sp. A120]|nr:unnamed protein product [Amoebophrya sp. A120]|eukprot:GSA120T00004905001.1
MFSTGKPRGKPAAGAKKKLKHGGASMSNLAALYGGQETGKEVTEQDKHEELMRKRRNYLQVSANKDRQLFQEKMLQSGNTAFNSMRNDSKDSSSQNETLPLTLEQELDYADTTELRELFEATDAAMAQDDILRRLQTGLPLGEYQTIYIKDVVEEGVKHMRSTKPRNWAEYLYGRERAGMRANMYMPGSAASGQQQQLQGLHPAHHHSPERQSTIPPIGPGSASNVLKDLIGGASQADQALSQMNVFMQTHVDTMDSIETLLSELNEGASSRGTGRETPQRPSLKIPRSAARESGGLNDGFDNMNKAGTSRGQKAVGWNLEPHRFRLDVEMGHFTMKKPPRHQSRLSHRKIWTAFDPSENIQACVKGEPHNLPRDESVLHKEARILARLQEDEDQPGIPYMYAFGLNEISKQYLLVTELLGPNLEQLFAHEIVGRKEAYGFDTKTVLGIGLQALRALSYVHKCNILHRAVKPSNFAVGNVTNVWNKKLIYLLDYGWAKDLGPVVEAQREKDRTENIKKEGELLKRRGGGASQQEQKSNAGTSIVDGGPTGDPVDGPPQNQFVELPNIADWPRYREVAKRTKKSFHADDDLIAVTKDLPYNNHVLFASPQAHRNQLNATWRDDYCALGYMMVYWLSGGSLPWSDRISEENLFPESARFLNLKAKAKRESERKHLHHHRGHSAGSDGSRGNKGAGSEQSDSFSTTSDDRNNLDEDLDLPNNNLTHEDDENDLVTPDIFRTASAVCFAPNLRDKDDQPPTWPLPLQQQMRGDRIRAKEVLTLVTRRRVLQEIEAAKTSTTWTKVCQPVPGKKMRAKFIEFFRYVYEGRAISSTIDMLRLAVDHARGTARVRLQRAGQARHREAGKVLARNGGRNRDGLVAARVLLGRRLPWASAREATAPQGAREKDLPETDLPELRAACVRAASRPDARPGTPGARLGAGAGRSGGSSMEQASSPDPEVGPSEDASPGLQHAEAKQPSEAKVSRAPQKTDRPDD